MGTLTEYGKSKTSTNDKEQTGWFLTWMLLRGLVESTSIYFALAFSATNILVWALAFNRALLSMGLGLNNSTANPTNMREHLVIF